jgi:hypothetical protein
MEVGLDHPLCVRLHGFGIGPYLQELSCHMGQEEVYEQAQMLLSKYLRVSVSSKQIERLCNTHGEKVADHLYSERLDQARSSKVYAMVDGSMIFTREGGWKEVKLGRIFEQKDHFELNQSKRGWIKDSQYIADMDSLSSFLDKMETSIPTQSELVFIADGAKWIWNWVESIYPESIQILDFYHAKEHACEFAALQFRQKELRNAWIDQAQEWLIEDQLDLLIEELGQMLPANPLAAKARDKLLGYYWNNYHRMQYKSFREQGVLIGSGPIESAHRTVIQKRLKRSGQRWIAHNAQKVINLRVANLSHNWNLVVDLIKSAA